MAAENGTQEQTFRAAPPAAGHQQIRIEEQRQPGRRTRSGGGGGSRRGRGGEARGLEVDAVALGEGRGREVDAVAPGRRTPGGEAAALSSRGHAAGDRVRLRGDWRLLLLLLGWGMALG
uniref:DUF834 domain-containing protein n=1 Tax=Oryza meridionalis TaxID=40149 RepID=A0A0E0D8U3_9ORYZ